jgi:hypothetical protein
MASLLHELRKQIHPRVEWSARGPHKPIRASDVIAGMMLVMGLVWLVAYALTFFFTAL